MAKRMVTVSDISDEIIAPDEYVEVTFRFARSPNEKWVLELRESEVPQELLSHSTRKGISGRQKKVENVQ